MIHTLTYLKFLWTVFECSEQEEKWLVAVLDISD